MKVFASIALLALIATAGAAEAVPGGCLKYGAAGAAGGHLLHHGVRGFVGGCAVGMYRRHEYKKQMRVEQMQR